MLETLKLRIYQGEQFIKDIENAPMRSQFRGFPKLNRSEDISACRGVCPTGALDCDNLAKPLNLQTITNSLQQTEKN